MTDLGFECTNSKTFDGVIAAQFGSKNTSGIISNWQSPQIRGSVVSDSPGLSNLTHTTTLEEAIWMPCELKIPGVQTPILKEDFKVSFVKKNNILTKIIIENDFNQSWLKLRVELQGKLQLNNFVVLNNFELKDVTIQLLAKTVLGGVLFTRFFLLLAKFGYFAVVSKNPNIGKIVELKAGVSKTEEKQLTYLAKFYRKLKYLEDILEEQILLPTDKISFEDAVRVDWIFRGIVKGNVFADMDNITLFKPQKDLKIIENLKSDDQVTPISFDLNGVTIFHKTGQKLELGQVRGLISKAKLDSINQLTENNENIIAVGFLSLEQYVILHFKNYIRILSKNLTQLEEFKKKLASEEPEEIVNLIDQPINGYTHNWAMEVVAHWLYSRRLGSYSFEVVDSDNTEFWQVKIYLADSETGEKIGGIGEATVDKKEGKLISNTPEKEIFAREYLISESNKRKKANFLLEQAAESGDECAFLAALEYIDWKQQPSSYYIHVIKLALLAGAHLVARRLSIEGATHYPEDLKLQQYAHLLAPPKFIRSYEPADPSVKRNREWMKRHSDQYHDRWIALKNGELLADAESLKELKKQVNDTKGVLLTKVY